MNPKSADPAGVVLGYHESTKHTVEKIYARRYGLDWANMPDPFRHYEGAPILDLPAGAPPPVTLAIPTLQLHPGTPTTVTGLDFLSTLLFHAAAISATKIVPSTGARYALRVNPSSGNLHPTEFHFATQNLKDWPDGLYHYRPADHTAEQRQSGGDPVHHILPFTSAPLVFVLTTIHWREAWKYQDRAYRYCCHDIGHAAASLTFAAQSLGCQTQSFSSFPDDEIQSLLQLEDEWPMLILAVSGAVPSEVHVPSPRKWHAAAPNKLSPDIVRYPAIEEVHEATKQITPIAPQPDPLPPAPIATPASSTRTYAETVRHRRSALDFRGGMEAITTPQLETLLHLTAPHTRDITLYLFLHRVRDQSPGLYRYHAAARSLEFVRPGDFRLLAAALSLSQDLAANSVVTFSMCANLAQALERDGARGYRHTFFEAGFLGQVLYLASEALGFGSTGIGAFYDDEVHRHLEIAPEEGQVIYHFASGFPVRDPRLGE